ncbi:MAG: beta strand repeat-containing protein, partial [Rhodoluna sp.]
MAGAVSSTGNANITVTADALALSGSINAGTGTATIQNKTAGTKIAIGGSTTGTDVRTTTPKTLGIDSTELTKVTAATTIIGRNDSAGSGDITVSATNMGTLGNTGGNLTVLSGSNITVSGAVTKTAGTDAKLTLTATNGVDVGAAIGSTSNKLNVDITASGLGTTSKGFTLNNTINANGGVVNITGESSAAIGVYFSGGGINAATYTVKGKSSFTNPALQINGTNSFISTTCNSLLEGTNTNVGGYLGALINVNANVTLNSGSGTTAITSGATSTGGVRTGYGGPATITTLGDVTIGSKNNGNAVALYQGTTFNAQAGKLTLLGKSSGSSNGIGFQDAGGTGNTINGTLGAQITIDGESSSGVGVNMAVNNSSQTLTTTGTGASISITGTSATSTGVSFGTASSTSVTNNADAGALTITGTSLGGSGIGIDIGPSTVNIKAKGNLTVTGNAVANYGARINAKLESTAGNVAINGATSSSGSTIYLDTSANLISSGTTTLTGNSTGTGASIGSNTTSGDIAATGGLVVDINKAGVINSVITGGVANAGGLTKQGAGALSLYAANTHKGTTLVSAGTLALYNTNALQNSTLDTGTLGAQQVTLLVSGTNTYNIGGLQGSDDLALGVNRISVGANNSTTTYSGILSGSAGNTGGITKVGTGNLTLSGASTVTGDYNADGGTLSLTGASNTYRSLTGVNVNINNGATVSLPAIVNGGFVSTNVVWTFGAAGGGTLDIGAGTNFVSRGTTTGNKFVTSGGATNTISGNINLDGTSLGLGPTFDVAAGAGNVTGLVYTGAIGNGSNTQTFTKTGAGLMQMSGANDLKGPVSISAGTLELTGSGTLGASVGNISLGLAGAFKSSSTAAQTITGVISGQGSLIQAGTGAMTLTANNTYSGGTTINNGRTLNVGNGSTAGSLGTGGVLDNGTLVFNRSDTNIVDNNISGTGALTQSGSGTTVLTSNNTYQGTTTISAGTLRLGNGGTSGTLGTGSVIDNAALVFNRSDNVTVANTISGTGDIRLSGTGTTIFTANNSYSGTTTVNAGTLQVGNGGATGSLGNGN